jgi:hypothetical protein
MPVRLRLIRGDWQAELVPDRLLGVDAKSVLPELTALLGPGHVEYVFNGT